MQLAIGCDHVALDFKNNILNHLAERQIPYIDFGCFNKEVTDYPIYAEAVARAVTKQECGAGLLFCGTGVGMSLAANKVKGIRAVVCSDGYTAKLAREHNDTNILALGSRVVGVELAKMIIDIWLEAGFKGERHLTRIKLIHQIEAKG